MAARTLRSARAIEHFSSRCSPSQRRSPLRRPVRPRAGGPRGRMGGRRVPDQPARGLERRPRHVRAWLRGRRPGNRHGARLAARLLPARTRLRLGRLGISEPRRSSRLVSRRFACASRARHQGIWRAAPYDHSRPIDGWSYCDRVPFPHTAASTARYANAPLPIWWRESSGAWCPRATMSSAT